MLEDILGDDSELGFIRRMNPKKFKSKNKFKFPLGKLNDERKKALIMKLKRICKNEVR